VVIFCIDAVIQMATLRLKVGSGSWADQFMDCFYANGKPDWSEAESLDTRSDPTMLDYVLHFVTFPWKVMIYPFVLSNFYKDILMVQWFTNVESYRQSRIQCTPSHTGDAVRNNNEIFTCASILI